ncbi:hypothetical protein V6N13_034654 [Hibiscus sabdariffa]
MDFGVLGLVGIVYTEYDNGAPSPCQTQSFLSIESKPKLVGSGFTKQERSPGSAEEDQGKSYFRHLASDSLIKLPQRSYYPNSKESGLLLDFTGQETQDQNPHHQSIDVWPKYQPSPSVITWPDELKSDRTLLFMSIPLQTSEFSSSSFSPAKETLDLSSLRLFPEFNPIQMGLG